MGVAGGLEAGGLEAGGVEGGADGGAEGASDGGADGASEGLDEEAATVMMVSEADLRSLTGGRTPACSSVVAAVLLVKAMVQVSVGVTRIVAIVPEPVTPLLLSRSTP